MRGFDSMTQVAVVGAGPYGLSLAAHLDRGHVPHRIFGRPMHTWQNLLTGMGLKSHDFATNVYVPARGNRFVEYCRAHGKDLSEPIAFTLFAEYGMWVQRRLVPQVETCHVTRVTEVGSGFLVTAETGERVLARRVVMATGLAHWERMPAVFGRLHAELVSHTSRHSDFSDVRGRDVTVIGAGASALEAATVLHERGAAVRLLVRGGPPQFASEPVHPRPLKERLLYPPSVLGPGRLNFILERAPTAVHHLLSDERRIRLTRTRLGPLGPWWIRRRFDGNVDVHTGCDVTAAADTGSGLRLTVRREGRRDWDLRTDRVVCGTGFDVDVDRHPVLDPTMTGRIERIAGGAPSLNRHFESSVPGLYFIGPASMFSFGPLFRFVAGAGYAAPALARHLARTARPARARTPNRALTAPARPD